MENVRDFLPDSIVGTAVADLIEKHATLISVPKGSILVKSGEAITAIPIVIKGALRVMRENESGNELLLYYVQPKESCVLSVLGSMQQKRSEITAVAAEDSVLLAIPSDIAREWSRSFFEWQQFVWELYSERYHEILETLENIAFKNIDERLWMYLQKQSSVLHSRVVSKTHNEIAIELGTSREVVSRLLKQLERQGKVELLRNEIRLM